MARQKGMLNLSGNLEPLAGAPLDSRTITPTVADLYIASNWPYKYIGMKTTVTATGDTYRLVDLDVTKESSWVLDGGSGGQTIQVESMPMATESDLGKVLQYIGTTNLNYINGYFYKCVYKNNLYLWEQQNVQPDKEGQTIQVSELPTAAIGQADKVYQYIGATGNGLVHGYFYECVLNDGSYVWQETAYSGTVIYNANEGILIGDQTITVDEEHRNITLPDATKISRLHHIFKGWQVNGTGDLLNGSYSVLSEDAFDTTKKDHHY